MKTIKIFQSLNNLQRTGDINAETVLKMRDVFKINDIALAHFLAQLHHESAGFKFNSENLNYSWKALRRVFGKYFKTEADAKSFQRNPEAIANKVYANRMGNGDESSGDGWKFRGRGNIQLTGYNNYKSFSEYVQNPKILTNPELVANRYSWSAAVWFFKTNKIFDLCTDISDNTIKKITRKINGGYNGLSHRTSLTKQYYDLIKNIEINENVPEDIDSDISDSDDRVVVAEPTEQEEVAQVTKSKQKRDSKTGFFGEIIRWILQKISGGHSG